MLFFGHRLKIANHLLNLRIIVQNLFALLLFIYKFVLKVVHDDQKKVFWRIHLKSGSQSAKNDSHAVT